VLRAAGLASADPDPLVRLGAVAALDAAPPDARLPALLPLVDDPVRAVRLEAARSLAAVRPDRLPSARRAAFERALDEYVDAQRVNADRAESHVNLGILHAQRDEQDEAAAAFEAAIGRNPSFVPAYVNLAEIHRRQQRDDRAERVLTRALERLPEAADLHHALGLTRVRLQRQAEALPSLARAAELAPDQARYAYVFGVALYSAGRPRDALEALGLAHDRHPYDVDILAALATMSRDVGVVNDAVEYARRLVGLMPNDPEAQRLLADLEAGQ
jgi:tetratricopeptide (TPR) repeat protein